MDLIYDVAFCAGGSGLKYLGRNWHRPESEFIWASRHASSLKFAIKTNHSGYLIDLNLRTYRGTRKIALWSNGRFLGSHTISGHSNISVTVPGWCIVDGVLSLGIYHQKGTRVSDVEKTSSDNRILSIALDWAKVYGISLYPEIMGYENNSAALKLNSSDLMKKFQSLGDNCEFGIVQRNFNIEPLGLLRFSGMNIDRVVHGLATRFVDLVSDEQLTLRRHSTAEKNSEFIVQHSFYGLNQHTFVFSDDTDAKKLLEKTKVKLAREAQMLFDDLEDAEKIFVIKRGDGLDGFELQDFLPLWSIMRGYGNNTLLCVHVATGDKIPGTVERKGPGLFCGYIDHFAHYDGDFNVNDDCWLSMCRNAYDLWFADRQSGHAKIDSIAA